ncbi:hypothetical protein [Herbiconiux ginsengi]|uniref:Glycosyl transferase family 2 n=1 Tax=Herbiconiux ginsengi TaxID=381665 RepID=A0A1H3STX5_9MICO|nr:hypothetical protein [Herbiconiux ginsengi]SDZ41190.1 hypothetical protein SAMN05216554_3676 [Herbiconiux ginsengi]
MSSVRERVRALAAAPVKAGIRRSLLAGRYHTAVTRYGRATGDEVPVVLCLWNRPSRLIEVLKQFDGQTGTPGIDLHVWNNNKLDQCHYEGVIAAFRATGALRSVHLTKTPYNLGSIARFYPARAVAKTRGPGPMIVIDDDEDITPTFVATALENYTPDALRAFWAFRVHSRKYWDRSLVEGPGRVDHIGPGGMVCDRSIFLDDAFFTELPQRYWLMDDLWLTYYAKRRGLTLATLPVDIEFVMDDTNQYRSLIDLKQEFFEYLYP